MAGPILSSSTAQAPGIVLPSTVPSAMASSAAGHVGASAEFSDNYVSWIVVFDAFLFLGLALVVAVLITGWLSKDLKRHPTWYSFMVSWVLYAISYLLIVGHQHGTPPPFGICALQTSTVYTMTVVCSFTLSAILIQLYQMIGYAVYGNPPSRWWTYALVGFPYLLGLVMFLLSLAHGLMNPKLIERQAAGTFCHLADGQITKLTAIMVVFGVLILFVVEGMIFTLLYWNWTAVRRLGDGSVGMVTRVSFFSILPLIPFVLSTMNVLGQSSPMIEILTDVMAASLPFWAGVTFATSGDNLRVWKLDKCIPKRAKKSKSPTVVVTSFPSAGSASAQLSSLASRNTDEEKRVGMESFDATSSLGSSNKF